MSFLKPFKDYLGTMRFATLIAAILGVVVFQGCASLTGLFGKSQMKITIVSQPAGATIYYQDKYKGVAPQTLFFDVDETDRAKGYLNIGKIKAVWPSGATETRSSEQFDYNKNWEVTLIRPADAPNPDVDYRHADTIERNRIEQEKLKQLERENERLREKDRWRDEDSLENAASLCRGLLFSSEQNECMGIVRNSSYFAPKAIAICRGLLFDSEKLKCLRAAANREYLRAEIEICKNKSFDSEKISCLERGRRY